MAAVTEFCLLLLLLLDSAVLEEPLYLFLVQGQKSKVVSKCDGEDSYALFYRSSLEGDRLILNASGFGPIGMGVPGKHVITNVTQADSGDYYVECWNNGSITGKEKYNAVVCAEEVSNEKMTLPYGQTVDFELKDFNMTRGDVLHIYSVRTAFSYFGDHYFGSLFLNTSYHLETLDDDPRFRVQVLANSTVRISAEQRAYESYFFYHIWSGNVCRMRQTVEVSLGFKTLFLKHGQNATLPCLVRASEDQSIDWVISGRYVLSFFKKNYLPEVHVSSDEMYIVNGSHTGNYSLVIPFVRANISGEYECVNAKLMHPTLYPFEKITLFVCVDLDPINKTFSRGSRVILVCDLTDFNHTVSIHVRWYRQRGLDEEELILEHDSDLSTLAYIPDRLQGKVNSTSPQAYLAMFDLSPEDSGVYRCKVWGSFTHRVRGMGPLQFCSERRINLEYKDTFAIDSVFYRIYASMMGCGLLAMICALVYVAVKNKVTKLPNPHDFTL